MDVRELMIGDLVLCDDKPCRITDMSECIDGDIRFNIDDNVSVVRFGDARIINVLSKEISPIPISIDILRENNWWIHDSETYASIDNGPNKMVDIRISDSGFWKLSIVHDDYFIEKVVKYIRQVQDFLRFVGDYNNANMVIRQEEAIGNDSSFESIRNRAKKNQLKPEDLVKTVVGMNDAEVEAIIECIKNSDETSRFRRRDEMSNEEKAEEIKGACPPSNADYWAALNMANWKDGRFVKEKRELIGNACKLFDDHLQEMRRKGLLDVNECFKLGIAFRESMARQVSRRKT